ncbi:hypothetical protein HOLleu_01342 [Holothuria leucospilota]|uniref:Uncharacterized protein n=1 Tax=Holothuria leucospilota TaxID=206669 RepID=A0A9Q1CNX1_HOLLE|nr:hypothetical protein HOLleu_01342 [Holothuria leucospilota]
MFGREPTLPVDFLLVQTEQLPLTQMGDPVDQWLISHSETLQMAQRKAGETLKRQAALRKHQFDKRAEEKPIEIGSSVYVKSHHRGRCKIGDELEASVYKVLSRPDNGSVYVIQLADGSGPQKTVQRREIRPCPTQQTLDHSLPSISLGHGFEEVEDFPPPHVTPVRYVPDSSDDSSISSSDEDCHQLRRSHRITKGQHSNLYNIPRSARC